MTGHYSIYITTPDRETAHAIARALVEERLAACANVFAPVFSIYRWEGAVHEDGEVALIAKTSADRMAALIERVKALHPYQVPCIVAWPIADGYQPYLDWISAETNPVS
jgi:periplasmic divalent cation tolerance protein